MARGMKMLLAPALNILKLDEIFSGYQQRLVSV
jgi:hypothetical protein